MTQIPHPHPQLITVNCAIVTISDTRSPETDRSGQLIQELLLTSAHAVVDYTILPDEPAQIQTHLKSLSQRAEVEAVILNGGTGIAPRDTTYDAIALLLEKTLPGFGELFRVLSYQEIGSRAIASRAIAGLYQSKLIFSIPGSTGAVKLALEQLILPELIHLTQQIKSPGHSNP
jgi:molybdopterin adenylyltransferase